MTGHCPPKNEQTMEWGLHHDCQDDEQTLFGISCNYPCLFHYVNAHNMLV